MSAGLPLSAWATLTVTVVGLGAVLREIATWEAPWWKRGIALLVVTSPILAAAFLLRW